MEKKEKKQSTEMTTNPLRKERIYVRFVPQNTGLPKNHVLYGGLADGAKITLCAPVNRSTGNYKNILTDAEKDYLEKELGLASNALSVYRKGDDNYWNNYKIELTKEGIHLDLSDPDDYIKYKVLLANADMISPSPQTTIEKYKATYRFELVREGEETNIENAKMDATMASYKEFGKIEDDIETMRVLTELLDVRPYSIKESKAFFKARINALIQSDPKKFLHYITDPLLHAKVLLRRGTELGKIAKKGDYYYLASDASPLCELNENPTLSVAAAFLNSPAHQDLKFLLESEVEKNRV